MSADDKLAAVEVWNNASERFQAIVDAASNDSSQHIESVSVQLCKKIPILFYNAFFRSEIVPVFAEGRNCL